MKNIAEPREAPTPKVDLEPFISEESVSRDGNTLKKADEAKKKSWRMRTEMRTMEQEQSLRGDVFCEYQV